MNQPVQWNVNRVLNVAQVEGYLDPQVDVVLDLRSAMLALSC